MFCHNLKVGFGRLSAISYIRGLSAALSGLRSPYEVFGVDVEKEQFLETFRAREVPVAPSRLGAIFLFSSMDDAKAANAAWWNGARVILGARIVESRGVGEFDARALDVPRGEWEAAARAYWTGALSQNPRIEVLVNGIVQLDGWEEYARLMPPKTS